MIEPAALLALLLAADAEPLKVPAPAERADLDLRPERWPTRFELPAVTKLLKDPAAAPKTMAKWEARLAETQGLAEPIGWSEDILDLPPAPWLKPRAWLEACDPAAPKALNAALQPLLGALSQSSRAIKRASDSLTPEERALVEQELGSLIKNKRDRRLDPKAWEAAGKFDLATMVRAGRAAAQGVERALPALQAFAAKTKFKGRYSCKQAFGRVLIGGKGDNDYTPAETQNAALIIDLGGSNTYKGPAAAAGPGQLRAVIDLGNAAFKSTGPAAGSGRFGVGILYALGQGTITINAGDLSAGAGFFGVGAATLKGESKLETLHFSQGAGAFGVGVLKTDGPTQAQARFAGQGFALTRGVGLLLAKGSFTGDCGLYYPDPRDPSALQSLCQGAGYGPRAHAAGGIGIALIQGPATLRGSYFSQGTGYWRAVGALFIQGDGSRLLGRRYGQGSGIHSAIGALKLTGNEHNIIHWGVGPGYGWDLGLGLFEAKGSRNKIQADWGAGHADFNGRSIVSIEGNENTMILPGLGSGYYKRGGGSYSMAKIAGLGNALAGPATYFVEGAATLATTPWGSIQTDGSLFVQKIEPQKPDWPAAAPAPEQAEQASALRARLQKSASLPQAQRVRELLFAASASSLDPSAVARAAGDLSRLSPEDGPALVAALTPEDFDEMIWIRLLVPALGEPAFKAAKTEHQTSEGLKRMLLLRLLRSAPLAYAEEPAFTELKSKDWLLRRDAAGLLGSMLSRERGHEAGRLRLLEDSLEYLQTKNEEKFIKDLGPRRLEELFSALALDAAIPLETRLRLLEKAKNPFDPVNPDTLKEFAKLIESSNAKAAFAQELAKADALIAKAREALIPLTQDPEPEISAVAIHALGQIGKPEDANLLASALDRPTAVERDAAASALAKMGPAARSAIEEALSSPTPRRRALAALAAAQSYDPQTFSLLSQALKDSAEEVRLAAISGIGGVVAPLAERRLDLLPELRRMAREDPSPSVKASAAAWAVNLGGAL